MLLAGAHDHGSGPPPKVYTGLCSKEFVLKWDLLLVLQGLVFGRAHKHGGIIRSSAKGTGFAMARLENKDGETYWTAPSFVQVFGSGAGIAVGKAHPSPSPSIVKHLMTPCACGCPPPTCVLLVASRDCWGYAHPSALLRL